MEQVTIRDARPDEYDELGELIAAAYEEYAGSDDSPEFRAVFDEYRRELRDVRGRLEATQQIVAVHDGKLAGGVSFYPPGKMRYDNSDVKIPREWCGIRLLGVHPKARGLRVGRLLTEECLRRARAAGAPVIALHTTVLMQIAREMYVRMGFE